MAVLFFFLNAPDSQAVTWNQKNLSCPLCLKTSRYYVLGSYGGYVNYRESRFQLVEFPYDEELSLYTCIHCGYSVFMNDFSTPLKEPLKKKLKEVLADFRFPRVIEHYGEIPIAERMELAGICYASGVSCDCSPFWTWFYPIQAYHAFRSGQREKARDLREKTLILLESAARDPGNEGILKELLADSGILKYLLGDPDGARDLMAQALSMTYRNRELSEEDNSAYNRYLDEFIGECLKQNTKKPEE